MGSEYLVFYNKTELNTGPDNSLITSNNVGIANTNPAHNLSIGSNVYIDDTGANTIVTSGNVSAGYFVGDGSRLSNLPSGGTQTLQQTTDLGNTTSNTVQFSNATTALTATGNVIISNGFLGIGESDPIAPLVISSDVTQGSQIRMYQYSDTSDSPDLRIHKARGTSSSPSNVQSNDLLFNMRAQGWDGASFNPLGGILYSVGSNVFTGSFKFQTVAEGTSGLQSILNVDGSGVISFGIGESNRYNFPTSDGSASQVLQTDGAGQLSFATVSGGGGSQTLQQTTDLGNTTSNSIQFTNTSVSLSTIGYVGIGTTTPSANLHVSGNVHVTDEITCVGDITGNTSDDRLKIRLSNLENALEKVNGLQGFRYEYNDLAQSFGLKNKGTARVGLSAQDVQKVLPEAVARAPFSDQYLTLKYERLVPLLVESVKELSEKVDFLENKILSISS